MGWRFARAMAMGLRVARARRGANRVSPPKDPRDPQHP